jgi:hypothetical protein
LVANDVSQQVPKGAIFFLLRRVEMVVVKDVGFSIWEV